MLPNRQRRSRLASEVCGAALLFFLCGSLTPTDVAAQEPIIPLQFSFSDPGARSMGFGGAFVALADDATAAFSNPAGLVQLVRPEVSIEGRHWSYSTPFTQNGRVEGLPSGFGLDTVVGLQTARSETSSTGLSFLSLTYPKGNWSFALFRHELANYEFSSETRGLFGGGTDCCQTRHYDQRATTRLEFANYGISGAYRVNERLALGFGVIYHRGTLGADATLYVPDRLFGPPSYLPHQTILTQRVFSDDTDWAFIGGVLWKLSDRWQIGGVFRQGPELAISTELIAGEAIDLGVPPGEVVARATGKVEFPWVLGLGFAYRTADERLTVSAQWNQVKYSSIVKSTGLTDQTVDDADEVHLGLEYVLLSAKPVFALRMGAWMDPDHRIRASGSHPYYSAMLPRGEDQMHYTGGLGLALRRFQIDVGVDFANEVDSYSLSTIYTF